MKILFHHLIENIAPSQDAATALIDRQETVTYAGLWQEVRAMAGALQKLGLERYQRMAVYLEKRKETAVSFFSASAAGGVFVPINPQLRSLQVGHILRDCSVRILVTNAERLDALQDELQQCPELKTILIVGKLQDRSWNLPGIELLPFGDWNGALRNCGTVETDMAAILYTSGSTGKPKGVVLSHRNLMVGAESVSHYLDVQSGDRILAALPLSFDAGLSQLTTAFYKGASVVLLNYLLPRDVIRQCEKHRITGLTGVPPLWIKLAQEVWPTAAAESLSYFANTGGHMPRKTLEALRKIFPQARPFLMYGLTEAFRSTYLDPAEVDNRPDSIGKAIPNAEILILGEDGRECAPGEVGELVHRGPLVAMGYWNAVEQTALRFRAMPYRSSGLINPEFAVWSGDLVRKDEDGFLYFVGRDDDMIKTSGYRVSPSEIEEVVLSSGLVSEAVALGMPDDLLGQKIMVLVVTDADDRFDAEKLLDHCRQHLPLYMVPHEIERREVLPRNPNGKFDRAVLKHEQLEAVGDQLS